MRKVLGSILTVIIFINGDNRLKRMDFQRERLRDLYPNIRVRWMIADAACNSWCVAVCALAIYPLVWASDDANELILDTFGFLFLQSLDDYSSIIEYGIEQSDFDKLIHEQSAHVNRRTTWVVRDGMYERQAPDTDEDFIRKPHWLEVRWRQGDVLYSLGRLVNCTAFCFGWPAYISLKWVDEAPEKDWSEEILTEAVLLTGFTLLGLGLLNNLVWYIMHQPDEKRDFWSFFYQVFLLRPDPREVRQMHADFFGSLAVAAQGRDSLLGSR